MTDRELLELAAKAAGHDYECVSHTGRPENDQHQIRDWFGTLVNWNPLDDDGDALRLAVKLCLSLRLDTRFIEVWNVMDENGFIDVDTGNDPYAATRRAIVRAAAEIGKEVK